MCLEGPRSSAVRCLNNYAHMLIVVALLVAGFLTFLSCSNLSEPVSFRYPSLCVNCYDARYELYVAVLNAG